MENEEIFRRDPNEEFFSVKEMCRMTGATKKNLYKYDHAELLKPVIRSGTQRHKMYSQNELEKLEIIRKYREAGLYLAEIKEYLNCKESERQQFLYSVLKRQRNEKNQREHQIQLLLDLINESS